MGRRAELQWSEVEWQGVLRDFGTIWHKLARFVMFLAYFPQGSRIYSDLPVLPKIGSGFKKGRGEHPFLSAEDAEGRGELRKTFFR